MLRDLLVEREDETAAISAGIASALERAGACVIVVGAAGIGKTRLLEEARSMAAADGMRVLSARGAHLERGYAFGLVRQLFESSLRRAGADERERWLSGAAAAAGRLLAAADGEQQSEMSLLHSLFWLTANVCQERPVLLVVDDLHWADEPSLRFLAYLQQRLYDMPLFIAAATRPSDPSAAMDLLDLVLTHPECRILQPKPLSPQAVGVVLAEILGESPKPTLLSACHTAAAGNPLLVKEVARALASERDDSAIEVDDVQLRDIGTKAVARRVSVELRRLSPAARRVAEAVAVLGRHADPRHVAAVTALAQADRALNELASAQILRRAGEEEAVAEFLHPLVRSAVYEQMDPSERVRCHLASAALLTREGHRAEETASHLLRVPNLTGEHVSMLRKAGMEALANGAPESAHAYLAHALTAEMTLEERLETLKDTIGVDVLVDVEAGLDHLAVALRLVDDPVQVAEFVALVGLAKLWVGLAEEMTEELIKVIADLPENCDDLRRGLEAILLDVPLVVVGFEHVCQRVARLRRLPPSSTINAALLESMIAGHESFAGDPRGLDRAREALAHPQMLAATTSGASASVPGYLTLLIGDLREGMDAYGELVTEARRQGSTVTLGVALTYRGMGWLRMGELAEAENDLREVIELHHITPMGVVLPLARGLLAEVLLEKGRIDDASAVITQVSLPPSLLQDGILYPCLHVQARILAGQGRYEAALEAAVQTGERFAAYNGGNPALVAWRSQAALCLHALGDTAAAQAYAHEELELAERWGAPYAIGHALRVAGLVSPMPDAVTLLERSVEVLRPSPARLELAYALVDLSACRRRQGQPAAARSLLQEGMDLAQRCGADPLVTSVRDELRALGARPRRSYLTGLEALTPSEARVAGLAATGLTNRQIAQRLYITVKTVEVHLSNTYQKLRVRRRNELGAILAKLPGR
ncbi:AAA family ATPase [Microbispora sp. NEAU-D428]|uniref:helix-turn-helix transcriptional regulator n=1 Tax=Microbispora sitophila TaxID=2771537 RepID=UPI001867F027|nr:LuxR family transcriptional regulator [Microbispora sitophila]MBE3014814.1 AAA family ATPase [Microbispora sitophila]